MTKYDDPLLVRTMQISFTIWNDLSSLTNWNCYLTEYKPCPFLYRTTAHYCVCVQLLWLSQQSDNNCWEELTTVKVLSCLYSPESENESLTKLVRTVAVLLIDYILLTMTCLFSTADTSVSKPSVLAHGWLALIALFWQLSLFLLQSLQNAQLGNCKLAKKLQQNKTKVTDVFNSQPAQRFVVLPHM